MHRRYSWIPILFLLFGFVLYGSGCGKQAASPVTTPLPAPVAQKTNEDPEGTKRLIWEAYRQVLAEVASGEFPVDAGKAKSITQGKEGGYLFIDLRSPADYAGKHVRGAVNLSIVSLAEKIDRLPADKTMVLYCYTGQSSALAMAPLKAYGYQAIFINGGFANLEKAGFVMDTVKSEFSVADAKREKDSRAGALAGIKTNLLAIARQHSVKTLVVAQTDTKELVEGSPSKYAFVDLRPREDFERGHIRGSISAPLAEMQSKLSLLPKDKRLILCCKSGQLAAMATAPLTAEGFKIISLCAGFSQLNENNFPMEKKQ